MAENSKIEWCDHTFNPWIGCTKISPACDNCYAEAIDNRFGGDHWGPKAPRRRTAPANWRKPLKWNKDAEEKGIRYRVFCASMADVFDNRVDAKWREDLWKLIGDTPYLDWLLLTKRPQNIEKMLPDDWGEDGYPNVWLGTTVENQDVADRNIIHLLENSAAIHFLSMEPLLQQVDIGPWLSGSQECANICGWRTSELDYPRKEKCNSCGDSFDSSVLEEFCPECGSGDFSFVCPDCDASVVSNHPETVCLDWVITGGESGPGARPMHSAWVESIRDQCQATGTPFLFKQWGEWCPLPTPINFKNKRYDIKSGSAKIGKKAAGRLLDGRTWDEFPGPDIHVGSKKEAS